MLPDQFQTFAAEFPLEHVHAGVAAGNGFLGLSVWGEGDTVNVTVSSSSLWDHQGGEIWSPDQSYKNICAALAKQDENRMKELFPWYKLVPSIIPLARIAFQLDGAHKVELSHRDSLLTVFGKDKRVEIRLSQSEKGVFAIRGISDFRLIPGYDLAPVLKERGFAEPERLADGFRQTMPKDPAFGIRYAKGAGATFFCFSRDVIAAASGSWSALEEENRRFWNDFWMKVPELHSGMAEIDARYCAGLFQFQCMTASDGFPAGLQGPWIEDEKLPPWSSDFHFNINVQMCYWPACRAGLFDNLKPLWKMLESWKERMRRNAKCFVGIDDGYMIPHAVDDRCVGMGGFWAGTMDHTSAGWMAMMMFEYVRCTGDIEFLKRFGFDFMRGVMRVYEAMLEFDGSHYAIPWLTSPEYRGIAMDAVGRNPSFHLAAIHRLLSDIFAAAEMLHCEVPASWHDIQEKLPWYSEEDGEIALWEGLKLDMSHRHHSHLAAICPFDSLHIPEDVVERSVGAWVRFGMGTWAGWSMPWAAMLHNRFNHPDMACMILKMWPSLYTNKGGRTLHDPQFPGFSVGLVGTNRIMQMDAGLGVVAAILDLFLYETQGVLELFHGLPEANDASCANVPAPGGLRFSGNRREFSFTAERSAVLNFRFPAGEWMDETDKVYAAGTLFSKEMKAGEQIAFYRKG